MTQEMARMESLISAMQDEQKTMNKQIKDLADCVGNGGTVKKEVAHLVTLVDGDASLGVEGLRQSVERIDKCVNELVIQRRLIKWMLIVLGATSLVNAGQVLNLLVKALGGP